ncbi:hypothetical protein CHLNCDRAFT_145622 [Chlorella variabilis]|uniref:Uncharacterized protein n=1 Tax=Chlorella variabilis TaxID=554065 RepID=E1ZDV5_CHLVA|nr:hypothetical protein CHLNCDRAFT_145622 [Chlorella variabilis]EFN56092.1 hypothetical protein CHLNCDRAFT_145622 [Chlorella variabilis]|eukprot:XP_005848194.1 hypothetical protein CHLNCDRAFT_145622 [Chlorella variabilis]
MIRIAMDGLLARTAVQAHLIGCRVAAWRPHRRRRPAAAPPSRLCCRAAHAAREQLTLVAARLSTVRCRELLAATVSELIKAALVGSAAAAAATAPAADTPPAPASSSSSSAAKATPEALLEALHATVQASLQDAAHQIAPEHQEAWGEAQWEVFQEAHSSVHRLLLGLHSQAADAGSGGGALQVARCLEHGLLVPRDGAAAFRQYRAAAALSSAEGSLRCGIHFFEGTAPGGRDGAQAYDCLSQALDLAEAELAAAATGAPGTSQPASGGAGGGGTGAAAGADREEGEGQGGLLPPLAAPPAELAVEGDLPLPLTAAGVRFSALTWMGRCYLEGAGVPRSAAQAADCFRAAGNETELRELAALKRMFEEVEVPA